MNKSSHSPLATKQKEKQSSSRPKVYICGESPLVEEAALRCASSGYAVKVHWNISPTETAQPLPTSITTVNTIPDSTAIAFELTNTDIGAKKKNIQKMGEHLPSTTPILSSSVTVTATEQANWIEYKYRLVGIGAFPTLLSKPLIEVVPTIYTPKETLQVISNFFASLHSAIEIVEDQVGLVQPRLLCGFINQIYFALEENIAPPDDIDRAITQGLQFSVGPIALSETFGFQQIYATLEALQRGNSSRYSIAPLIQQFATTGRWWKKQQKEDNA